MKRAGEAATFSVPELPVNPRVLTRLLASLDDGSATTSSLASVILTDPALTLAVLRAVLAGTGFPEGTRTFSMEVCVDAVGRDLLQAYAFMRATRQVAGGLTDKAPGPLADAWRHSLLCAELSASLARATGQHAQVCYLAGLLCDVGSLARYRLAGPSADPTRSTSDLQTIGNEATLNVLAETEGAWVGRGWLPPFVADALRMRKASAELLADAPFVARALRVALVLAASGATEPAFRLAKQLLGLDDRRVSQVYDDAVSVAQAQAVGLDVVRGLDPNTPTEGTDLLAGTWDAAVPVAAPAEGGLNRWVGLGQAVGEAGFRHMLQQSLAGASGAQETLERLRRACRLLTPLDQPYFFLTDAQARALVGTPLSGDPPELSELKIRIELSPSLVASCARERRPIRMFGAKVTHEGAAVDRVIARMLATEGLLLVPMVDVGNVIGVFVFGVASPSAEDGEETLLTRLAASAAAAIRQAEQLRRQQEVMRAGLASQFQALGRRVVHEAGNPLSIVKNYLKVLGNKLVDTGQFREELGILNEEMDRIARIVQRMGEPLSAESIGPSRLDLNAAVREVMTLCNDTLLAGRNIEVQQQLDPQIPILDGDPGGVKQVVLNLLTNAVEAMAAGGRLTLITADNVSLGGELFVLLQIADTGSGIGPDVMQRLFQPGASNKGDGHQGIGLAVSESILRSLGGRILCRSSVGRGTIFIVLLPRRVAVEDSPAE